MFDELVPDSLLGPGADEHQERGGRIEGGHVVTKPFQPAVKKHWHLGRVLRDC